MTHKVWLAGKTKRPNQTINLWMLDLLDVLKNKSLVQKKMSELPSWSSSCKAYNTSNNNHQLELLDNCISYFNTNMDLFLCLFQLPRLFDGCQFYFHGTFNYPTPEKEDLIELVKFGGGHVLSREPKLHSLDPTDLTVPFHAQNSKNEELSHCGLFIIHDNKANYPRVRHKHLCSAPAAWITECIASFSLCALPNN